MGCDWLMIGRDVWRDNEMCVSLIEEEEEEEEQQQQKEMGLCWDPTGNK